MTRLKLTGPDLTGHLHATAFQNPANVSCSDMHAAEVRLNAASSTGKNFGSMPFVGLLRPKSKKFLIRPACCACTPAQTHTSPHPSHPIDCKSTSPRTTRQCPT